MHRVLRCMVLALALLIPAPRAQANETLIFGLPQEPPWTFENTDGSLSGLSNNLVFYLISGTDAYVVQNDPGVQISGSMSKQ